MDLIIEIQKGKDRTHEFPFEIMEVSKKIKNPVEEGQNIKHVATFDVGNFVENPEDAVLFRGLHGPSEYLKIIHLAHEIGKAGGELKIIETIL
jgi:hypothetical protein